MQVIEEEDLVAILKDVSEGPGSSDGFGGSLSTQNNPGDQHSTSSGGQSLLHTTSVETLRLQPSITSVAPEGPSVANPTAAVSDSVRTVTLCQPPLPLPPPPESMPSHLISAAKATATTSASSVGTLNKLGSKVVVSTAIHKHHHRLQTTSAKSRRKTRKLAAKVLHPQTISTLPTCSTLPALTAGTTIIQHVLPSQDIDLYLNSANSNVSPDSGIQSEGGVPNSSPLHAATAEVTAIGVAVSQPSALYQPATAHIQHQTISMQQYGHSAAAAAVLTQTTRQQSNWSAAAAAPTSPVAAGLVSSMQQGAFYGQYVQQSSSTQTHSPQFATVQNQTNTVAAQTTYVYHNGPVPGATPILVGTATATTTTSQKQVLGRRPGGRRRETPPPTLLPSVQQAVGLTPLIQFRPNHPKLRDANNSSSSSAGSGTESKEALSSKISKINKRGRGRPKGSKTKNRKKVKMVTSGSQTIESDLLSPSDNKMPLLNAHYSTTSADNDSDSNSSSVSVPPPPVFMGAANPQAHKISKSRPRSDPPLLQPEISRPKPKLMHRVKDIQRKISKTPLSGEVILLESDDSTVFSDNEEDDEDEDEAIPIVEPKKKTLPSLSPVPPKLHRNDVKDLSPPPPVLRALTPPPTLAPLPQPVISQPPPLQQMERHHLPRSSEKKKKKKKKKSSKKRPKDSSVRDESSSRKNRKSRSKENHESSTSKPSQPDPPVSIFSGNNGPMFDKKFINLKCVKFWDKSSSPTIDTKKSEPAPVLPSETPRVMTKGSLKDYSYSVNNLFSGSSTGASTKTMLGVLASANKPKGKPGRKKKRESEWADSPRSGKRNKKADISPGSSCHSSKSPFSPRSSVGSDHGQGDEQPNVKYGGMLDCSLGYKTKKKKKEKESNKGWKTKHKNIIDPVFLSELEQTIQDMASCEIEVSHVSKNYWPERPHDSVPSIFRRIKLLSGKSKKLSDFANLLQPASKQTFSAKEKGKRGRPKKAQNGPFQNSQTSTQQEKTAEARLPLKKRHRHHISPSKIDDSGTLVPTRRSSTAKQGDARSKEGKSSRKTSLDSEKPSRRLSAAERIAEKLNLKLGGRSPASESKKNKDKPSRPSKASKPENAIESMAACVDKYTLEGKLQSDTGKLLPVEISVQIKDTNNKHSASPISPPRKRPFLPTADGHSTEPTGPPLLEKLDSVPSPRLHDDPPVLTESEPAPLPLSPPRLSPAHSADNSDSLPKPVYAPRYSDISEDEEQENHKINICIPPIKIKPVPTAQSLTSAAAEDAFDKLQRESEKETSKEKARKMPSLTENLREKATPVSIEILPRPSSPGTLSLVDLEGDPPMMISPKPDLESCKDCSVRMDKLEIIGKDKTEELDTAKTKVMKRKKRKANRTGFPSVKKKKKMDVSDSESVPKVNRKKRRKKVDNIADDLPQRSTPTRFSARITNEVKEKEEKEAAQNQEITAQLPEIEEERAETPVTELKETEEKSVKPLKRPRGRPPKKRPDGPPKEERKMDETKHEDGVFEVAHEKTAEEPPNPEATEVIEIEPVTKKPRLEEDSEEDCLALLPIIGMESGPSSEAPSGTETDDTRASGPSTSRKKKKKVSLFKKKSLVAGLFSDYYKSENEPDSSSARDMRRSIYKVEEHVHGLLPPPYYCGRQLRQKREDFQLPYDLWWLHANKQLPGRDVAATWNYKRIKNNIFFDVKPYANFDAHACQCTVKSYEELGCGDDCINRMTYTECDVRTCPCGDKCTNNAIQKHRSINTLERFMTEKKGWGVKTKNSVTAGTFIMEYVGEVVSETEFKLRMSHEYVDDTHHYCLHLDGGVVIDGHRMGGECRFVNHSCEPNCEMQKWCVNGLYRMALFSKKDIEPNEELTYDYNFSLFNPHEGQACCCGSLDCRGVIGGRTQRVNGQLCDKNGQDSKGKKENKRGGPNGKKKSTEEIANTRMMRLLGPPMRALTDEEIKFIHKTRCLMYRNYEKVRRLRDVLQRKMDPQYTPPVLVTEPAETKSEDMIKTGLTALTTARSMQTRRLAIVQDDPEVNKVIKLAQALREIFMQIVTVDGNLFFF